MIDIILVSHRPIAQLQKQIDEITISTPEEHNLIVTCREGESASVNRNHGMDQGRAEVFVMLDDDITGLYPGWLTALTDPLEAEDVILSSARMIQGTGLAAEQMGARTVPLDWGARDVSRCSYHNYQRIMTACFAVKRAAVGAIRFDEGFTGSGFEDTAFMNHLNEANPGSRLVLANGCRVIHENEMKNQGGAFFEHNKERYLELFPDDIAMAAIGDWVPA